jgi:hypothetical protein
VKMKSILFSNFLDGSLQMLGYCLSFNYGDEHKKALFAVMRNRENCRGRPQEVMDIYHKVLDAMEDIVFGRVPDANYEQLAKEYLGE